MVSVFAPLGVPPSFVVSTAEQLFPTYATHRATTRALDHSCRIRLSASHPARCVACEDVRSHPVLVALVGECSIPVV